MKEGVAMEGGVVSEEDAGEQSAACTLSTGSTHTKIPPFFALCPYRTIPKPLRLSCRRSRLGDVSFRPSPNSPNRSSFGFKGKCQPLYHQQADVVGLK